MCNLTQNENSSNLHETERMPAVVPSQLPASVTAPLRSTTSSARALVQTTSAAERNRAHCRATASRQSYQQRLSLLAQLPSRRRRRPLQARRGRGRDGPQSLSTLRISGGGGVAADERTLSVAERTPPAGRGRSVIGGSGRRCPPRRYRLCNRGPGVRYGTG